MVAVDGFSACERCTSHCHIGGVSQCVDPVVCGPHTAVPCDVARSRLGGCGWEALRLNWPAIGVQAIGAPPGGGVLPSQVAA